MASNQEPTSYFSMPGSFHSEGVHPGLIRPPASPAATANSPIFASAILTPASPSTPSALPRPKHKRRRPTEDLSNARKSGSTATPSYRWKSPGSAPGDDANQAARAYVLAGNLDTPGAVGASGLAVGAEALADQGQLGESMFSDSDYRTVLGSKRRREDIETDHTIPSTLYTLPSHPPQKASGWGSVAFSTLGGVVGKVWDFCWGSTFKGFHAGAGQGFDATHLISHDEADSPPRDLPGAWNQDEDSLNADSVHPASHHRPSSDTHVGSEDYNPATSYSRASTPTRQPAKRRQTDKTDDLGRNWVVINQHDTARASPAATRPSMSRTTSSSRHRAVGAGLTPSGRRVTSASLSRASPQPGNHTPASRVSARRSTSRGGRHSLASNGWEKPLPASTASFASPRSSPVGTPREASFRDSHGSSTPSRRRPTAPASSSAATAPETRPSRPGHRRTHSNASAAATRSPRGSEAPIPKYQSPRALANGEHGGENMQKQSPRLTEEARRLAAKRRMEERDADVKIAAFNRRLQDMIRQGKEALGTTVDVEMEGPLEGAWEDDE